jgi:hypothetical protein
MLQPYPIAPEIVPPVRIARTGRPQPISRRHNEKDDDDRNGHAVDADFFHG